jgi:type IV pilus assembly protein PilB
VTNPVQNNNTALDAPGPSHNGNGNGAHPPSFRAKDWDSNVAPRLGEKLVALGMVTDHQISQALQLQRRSDAFIGQILVDIGAMKAQDVGSVLAEMCRVPYVDLLEYNPDPAAVALGNEDLFRDTRSIALRREGRTLHVAMADPLDVAAIDRIAEATGYRVYPHLTMFGELTRTLNDLFDVSARTSEALEELETETTEDRQNRASRADLLAATEAPIVRLVDSLIESALALRASDIHFESQERGMRVRFRIDGTLVEHAEIPRAQMPAVIARLKVLCLMDITESRRPQDGRMRHNSHGRILDIRVSTVPAVFGEKIVLRILDKSSVLVPLSRLGFLADQQKRFEALIRQPHGMVLVVGPTGSGKSTTLYSAMNLLNDAKRNIMTLEDPVEYNIEGLNQVQVNPRLGLNFASGLRTFVRQDPDVILVGEIRDHETAEMAIQASLTGHLMLSTLHTNNAVGTIARLTNLGVDPFLIAQALSGVVSQRLVAKICAHCMEDYDPAPEMLQAVGITFEEAIQIRFRRGRGCRACHGRGYLGRMGVYEVMVIDTELQKRIVKNVPEAELESAAIQGGMHLLRDSVMVAVRAGITTPEEMGRVVLARETE